MSEQLPPLPDPMAYCYEWDGPFGTRKFSSNFWNGREADRAVAIFNEDQMRAYASAAVEANHSPASMQLIAELVALLEICRAGNSRHS